MWAPFDRQENSWSRASPQCWRWHLWDRARLTQELGAGTPWLGEGQESQLGPVTQRHPSLLSLLFSPCFEDEQLLLEPLLQLLLRCCSLHAAAPAPAASWLQHLLLHCRGSGEAR